MASPKKTPELTPAQQIEALKQMVMGLTGELIQARGTIGALAFAAGIGDQVPGKPKNDKTALRIAAAKNQRGWNGLGKATVAQVNALQADRKALNAIKAAKGDAILAGLDLASADVGPIDDLWAVPAPDSKK